MVLGIRLIKSIVKKIGARRAVKEVVAEHGEVAPGAKHFEQRYCCIAATP